MPLLLVALFIGVPILEVSVISRVQEVLGWPLTLSILLADSVFGALLVRQEGTRAWQRFTRALSSGVPPTSQVLDGALILFGGALLLTPGFVTDVVGVLCVLGPTRSVLGGVLLRRFGRAAGPLGSLFFVRAEGDPRRRRRRGSGPDAPPPEDRRPPPGPGVIDVEVLDVQRNRPDPEKG